jgi:hypothetical protein
MNKLTALIEAAKAASKDDWWKEITLVNALEPYTTHYSYSAYKDAKFIALANPATILELCALLEKAEEALEETTALCTNYESVEEPDGYQFTEAPAVIKQGNEALAAIKQWKEQT